MPLSNSPNNFSQATLRSLLAKELSKMFSKKVPEYQQFTRIVKESNQAFLKRNPHAPVDSEK